MGGLAPRWWRFLPAGPEGSGARDILDAGGKGGGALSRTLRDLRDRLGAGRAASLLLAAESESGGPLGRPLRLLLVAGQQPRSLEDALCLGFAIAGFAVEIRAIEGVPALAEALDDESSKVFDGVGLTLVFLQTRPCGDAVKPDLVEGLASRIAARTSSPVALARFVSGAIGEEAADIKQGVVPLPVSFAEAAVFDDRFGASFGAILRSAAADRLSDAAAALAARIRGSAPKLVVTDLDGTLWSGVLGEGPPGTAPPLHRAYAEALAAMRRRGFVLAIASRNDPQDVARAFAAGSPPVALDDFAARAIGWADKATLVADVLADIGLAPGHAVFVDDDPVNCARVAARFPEMDVRHFSGDPEAFAAGLAADPLLAGGSTVDGERTEQYRRRAEVERFRTETPDIAAFLAGLRTAVTVLPLDAALLPRAAELGARVNQFRFTGLSPTAQALARRRSPLDFMVRLDDAFGPHGLVGLVLASLDGEAARIDNLLLSCRALERGVETAMLHALAKIAFREGCARIVARIEILPRNEPARPCLSRHGFVERSGEWTYDLGAAHGTLAEAPSGVTIDWSCRQEAGGA